MKKIIYLFAITLLLGSCGDEKHNDSKTENKNIKESSIKKRISN